MVYKILIVDDDVDFVRLLSARLMANNYEVATAFDAIAAISVAQKARPHLIILDIKLPCGGGFRVYENLRASMRTSRIPVLFVTGFEQVEVMQEMIVRDSLKQLALPFLIKPFTPEVLLKTIAQTLSAPPPGVPNPNETAVVKQIVNGLSMKSSPRLRGEGSAHEKETVPWTNQRK